MTMSQFIERYPDHAEEVEERAAIMEFHGNLPREEAERRAVHLGLERIERQQLLFEEGA